MLQTARYNLSLLRFSATAGFTLVELLVVIAVIGVLAGALYTSIDPLEQFERARDGQREQQIAMLARALATYANDNKGGYPAVSGNTACPGGTWMDCLVANGTIVKSTPDKIQASVYCAQNAVNGFCYKIDGTDPTKIVVYSRLAAKANIAQCTGGLARYFVWRSSTEKTGGECVDASTEPVP